MKMLLRRLWRQREGQDLIEYALITATLAAHGSVTHEKLRRPSPTQIGSRGPFEVSVIIRNM